MNVKKVLVLSAEETEAITNCGKLLREIDNGLKDGSIDELTPETIKLFSAVGSLAASVAQTNTTSNIEAY